MKYPNWVYADTAEGLDPMGVYCTECGERDGSIEDYRLDDNTLPWYIEDEAHVCKRCEGGNDDHIHDGARPE